MTPINIHSLQNFRLPLENQVCELFLNDPWYQKHQHEITPYYRSIYHSQLDEYFRDYKKIPDHSKEIRLIRDICNRLQIERTISAYQFNSFDEYKTITSSHADNTSNFFFNHPVSKYLLERELIPLIASEFGHFIFDSPITIPASFLVKKMEMLAPDDEEEYANLIRLYYLCNILETIHQFHCDRLAVYLTNFEFMLNAILQLERINNKKGKLYDVEARLRSFPNQLSRWDETLYKDYAQKDIRIFAMFLFSQDYNLIESHSLKNLHPQITLEQFMPFDAIKYIYDQMLDFNDNNYFVYQISFDAFK